MHVVMKSSATDDQIKTVASTLHELGFDTQQDASQRQVVLSTLGGPHEVDLRTVRRLPGVAQVADMGASHQLHSREHQAHDSEVRVGEVTIGGDRLAIFAGPCSVEDEELTLAIARRVKAAGAVGLRGGAFKPRTSPYSFQGLGEPALASLRRAADATGLLVITEVLDPRQVELMANYADILQVGSRSMENYPLLQEVGRCGKPVLLKRGRSATIEEWLMAAEYVLVEGNANVILCERGIRTFEGATRNTLDVSAIPVVKNLSHLPILVDPSHATGRREMVIPMSRAGVAAGADGLLIEVHVRPEQALSDGRQSIVPDQLDQLMKEVAAVARAIGRTC